MLNHLAPKIPGPRGNALADLLVELLWNGIGPPRAPRRRAASVKRTGRRVPVRRR
jgi:hypothetical protein